MSEINFWFSIGSTYTYLSVNRIAEVAKKESLSINWKPFSVRKIMMDMDNIPFTPPSKKVKSDWLVIGRAITSGNIKKNIQNLIKELR